MSFLGALNNCCIIDPDGDRFFIRFPENQGMCWVNSILYFNKRPAVHDLYPQRVIKIHDVFRTNIFPGYHFFCLDIILIQEGPPALVENILMIRMLHLLSRCENRVRKAVSSCTPPYLYINVSFHLPAEIDF